ncbi:MAG: hypothetical protein Q4E75_03395 [bacterium]|nr:hypothetical protein [bacterium]
MILIVKEKVYIQPIDIRFILDNYDNNIIPIELKNLESFNGNKFIELKEFKTIQFVSNERNIIKLNDFVDMSYEEMHYFFKVERDKLEEYIYEYLYDTIPRPLEDSNKIRQKNNNINIDIFKIINDLLDSFIDNEIYNIDYVVNNFQKYPIELRNLVYKYLNIQNVIEELCDRKENIELTKKILTLYYSKKEKQQIYNEILNDNLSKPELYPIKTQLKSIFSRINYTPEIHNLIISVNRLSKDNDITFINDDLMESLLKMHGYKTKFEETSSLLWEYIYVIGYKYLTIDSARMLEVDIERIKNFLKRNLDEVSVEEISKYNLELSNVIQVLMQFKLSNLNKIKKEIMYIMCAYFYLRIDRFEYNYESLFNILSDFSEHFITDSINSEMFLRNNVYAFNVSANIFETQFQKNNEKVKIKQIEKSKNK